MEPHVLCLFVLRRAEPRVEALLDRIPARLLAPPFHVLVVDDASGDRTAEIARAWADRRAAHVTVLSNPWPQGAGGSQKLAYRLAVEGGFAYVVHVPEQADPAHIERVVDVLRGERADVVVATPSDDAAPLPARLGRRAVDACFRRLTGSALRAPRPGLRGYAAPFLRRVSFEVNDNGDRFDAEILLQAHQVGARVVETSLGGEPAPAAGSRRAARAALASAAQYRMHQLGMFCSLRYRGLRPEVYEDKTQIKYSSHRAALGIVEDLAPRRVLDIGCGPGHLMRACAALGCEVTGVDLREPLPPGVGRFHRVDLERAALPVDAFDHDVVLLLDVIEHLDRPEAFLLGLRHQSRALHPGKEAPKLVISTPNVAFAAVRLNLLLGRFNYAERGILDITHKRLFTWESLLETLRDCGYHVERTVPIGAPFEAVLPGPLGRALGKGCDALARAWPSLFAFQAMVVCTPLPGVDHVLRAMGTEELPARPSVNAS